MNVPKVFFSLKVKLLYFWYPHPAKKELKDWTNSRIGTAQCCNFQQLQLLNLSKWSRVNDRHQNSGDLNLSCQPKCCATKLEETCAHWQLQINGKHKVNVKLKLQKVYNSRFQAFAKQNATKFHLESVPAEFPLISLPPLADKCCAAAI